MAKAIGLRAQAEVIGRQGRIVEQPTEQRPLRRPQQEQSEQP